MLVVLYGSAFVAAFNENIINVALISIMDEFGVSTGTAQWLVTGYMIITSIVVAITAFLSRRFRLRSLFFTASVLIIAGSVICALAPSFPVLLVFRLAQSIGTGIFIPAMMSTVLAVAPREKMGTYISIGGCMITFGPAFAPVVSGLMVTMIGWRAIFAPPAVFVTLLLIAGIFLVKNIAAPERIRLDVPSVVLAAVGLFLLVYGLSVLMENLPVALAAIAVGVVCLAVFAIRQFRVEIPLLNLKPLRNSLFLPVCFMVIVGMMTTFSMSVLLPLYFEGSLAMTSLMAGAMLLVPILMNALTSALGGRILDRFGSWPLLPCGFALIVIGQAVTCFVATQLSWSLVLVGSVISYAGVGFVLSPSQTAGLQTLPPDQNPHGVAIINICVQIAASIGPPLFIGILTAVSAGSLAGGASEAISQADGFSSAVFVAAIIALAGFLLAFVYAHVRHARRTGGEYAAGDVRGE